MCNFVSLSIDTFGSALCDTYMWQKIRVTARVHVDVITVFCAVQPPDLFAKAKLASVCKKILLKKLGFFG